MQKQQPSDLVAKTLHSPQPQQRPKATWHRPILTFVSLQTTASGTGSFNDGTGFSTSPIDGLDDSQLKP